ncbi:hypothetical protein E2C01_050754 [Portunus trituberculatus]|uniref:Uncharacterized protein n=1 Tax=Portunus trituberculatus TaxID=210409 RepID=A0A5B7GHS8_PORTR|nr:hypothetical protein [Portunus trituberculatus]
MKKSGESRTQKKPPPPPPPFDVPTRPRLAYNGKLFGFRDLLCDAAKEPRPRCCLCAVYDYLSAEEAMVGRETGLSCCIQGSLSAISFTILV